MTKPNEKLAQYAESLRGKYLANNKVLLIQTLQLQLDAFNREIAKNKGLYAYPPNGLQCLAKALSGRNVEVKILDLNYEFLKRINEDDNFDPMNWLSIVDDWLEDFKPSIVGATNIGVSTDLFKSTHPLTGVLKHVMDKGKYIVMAGGPVATNEYENYLKHDVCHFVAVSEGENKINFLFDQLLNEPGKHKETPGIYFKFNNEVLETEGQPDVVSLSGNLISVYDLIPIENYNNVGSLNPFSRMVGQDKRFTGIQLNRGCRAKCKFCGVPTFMGAGVRGYPYMDVLDELTYLIEKRGVTHFELLDDDFLGPTSLREEVIKLLGGMSVLRKKYGITWAAGNGLIAGSITDGIAQLIHDSGCIGFRIGIESGNPKMLKRMRKPASVHSLKEFAVKLREYPDIFVGGNYIIGLFGEETFGEMMDTYDFSCDLDVDWAAFSAFQFTSKLTVQSENLKHDGKAATEFNPSKDSASRELRTMKGIRLGLDVFSIPKDEVPSRDQIKEIWFVFNLLSNYIHNRNFRPEGNHAKLVSWLEAIHITYPQNPYMTLFAALGYILLGQTKRALERRNLTKTLLENSEYWRYRFSQFELNDLVDQFPSRPDEVYYLLKSLREKYSYGTKGKEETHARV